MNKIKIMNKNGEELMLFIYETLVDSHIKMTISDIL